MPPRASALRETPPPFAAREVRAFRDRFGLSQSILAGILNVSVELVQAWEGERRVPRGAALRLLQILRARPELIAELAPNERSRRAPERDRARTAEPAAERTPHSTRRGPGRRATDARPPIATLPAAGPPTPPPSWVPGATANLPEALLRGLTSHGIAFVTVGGVAAHLRGAPGRTDDLDIVYDRSPANLDRLATFLRGIQTTLRGAPGTIPFAADPRTLAHTAVLALDTNLGPLDLRQRIAGIGDFHACLANSTIVSLDGRQIPALTLDALIVSKRATGRSKDREEVRALEGLRSGLR